MVVLPTTAGTLTNTAEVTSNTPDPNLQNNTDITPATVRQRPVDTPPLGANPVELQDKNRLVHELEHLDYSVIGVNEIPPQFSEYTPNWGYNEAAMKEWLGRFRQAGYSSVDLSLLQRANLAEEATKDYYGQALAMSNLTAETLVELFYALKVLDRAIKHVEDAARTNPVIGTIVGDTLKAARGMANDMVSEMLNWWIDRVIKRDNPWNKAFKLGAATFVSTNAPRYF